MLTNTSSFSIIALKGKSGKSYTFHVYPVRTECKNESGVYVFTQKTKNSSGIPSHTIIYIGRTESFKKTLHPHHDEVEIINAGANCICLMQVLTEKERIEIENDLLGNYYPDNQTN